MRTEILIVGIVGGLIVLMSWPEFRRAYHTQLLRSSHHQLIDISKDVHDALRRRYGKRKPLKVETVDRGFTDEEFLRFLAVVDDPMDRCAFQVMAKFALRVGECAQLNGKNIQNGVLIIPASKGGCAGCFRIPDGLKHCFPAREPEESLFQRTSKQLRDRFALYRQKAGLNEIYCHTDPCGRSNLSQPRYRLSLHSLRHYGIQAFYKECKDIELTQRFARHRYIEDTIKYLRNSRKGEIESVLGRLSGPSISSSCSALARGSR